jgi:hypothetical protein
MSTPVRVVCLRCAGRYALVVDPDCPLCEGRGTVAVVVGDRVAPWAAARALGMHIGDYWVERTPPTDQVESARRLPLLAHDDGAAEGLRGEPPTPNARARVGRAAGAWLTTVGLRSRKPPRPRKTAVQRAEEHRSVNRAELAAEARRRRVEVSALRALGAAHPEEFEEMLRREAPLAALEDLWWA